MSIAATNKVMMPSVAVVSVTYNRFEPLVILFDQLAALNYDSSCLDIFLVDNASTDDTVARVRERFPAIHIIENSENSGVSAGFNMSIEAALNADRGYQYLWLLDSDAEVEADTLKTMIDAMEEDATVGVSGSVVYDPKQRDQLVTAGLRVDWQKGDIPLFVPPADDQSKLLDVDLIPACSMLTRASIYQGVGLWDNRFPLYWGDTDWCTRVLRHGYRVCCVPASRAWHRDWSNVVRGLGADSFIRDHLRGALLYFLRHDPLGNYPGARHLMLKIYVKAGLERLTGRVGYADAYLDAGRDILEGRFDHSFSAPSTQGDSSDISMLAAELAQCVSSRPKILLNQLVDDQRRRDIKAALAPHFESIDWREIESEEPAGAQWSEYRMFKPGQLLRHFGRLLSGFGRADVNVCDISTPLLYGFCAGRYMLVLDGQNRGLITRVSVLTSLGAAIRDLCAGLKAVYFDLPRALKDNPQLRSALDDDLAKTCAVVIHD